jgi:hypothetical protein
VSRSRKKTPICGFTSADSEAEDKAIWHRRYRRGEDVQLRTEALEFVAHHRNQYSSTSRMDKDGKQYFGSRHPELMRK